MMLMAALVPHGGTMVLLDRVQAWDASAVHCRARSHLDPANPLRRAGRLSACCGLEYALQAAAAHGALLAGGVAQAAGYVASLRAVELHVPWLDDPAHGELHVHARREHGEAGGMLYTLEVQSEAGATLVSGRASIALPA